MEKILFNDLNLEVTSEEKTFYINGQEITYRPFLPMEEKLMLAEEIINNTASDDETRFYNPGRLEIFQTIFTVKYYTNIDFDENDLITATNTYDKIMTSGIMDALLEDKECAADIRFVWWDLVEQTIDNIYKYTNSALGIITAASQDIVDTTTDIEKLNEDISNPDTLTLLKDVMTKLG